MPSVACGECDRYLPAEYWPTHGDIMGSLKLSMAIARPSMWDVCRQLSDYEDLVVAWARENVF